MEPIIAGPVITWLSNFFGIFYVSLDTLQQSATENSKMPRAHFPYFDSWTITLF